MAVSVVEVVVGGDSPVTTVTRTESTIETVAPGGTVVNVQWGYDFPEAPTEGQIFIKVTP